MQTPKPIFFQCFQHIPYEKVTNIESISEHISRPGQLLSKALQWSGLMLKWVCFVRAPV